MPGDLETALLRHINLSIDVNFRGPILTMRAAVPHMRAAGGGHIINVSSRGSDFPGPGPYGPDRRRRADLYHYPAKSGLEHFSQKVAQDLQDANISVNVLSPTGRIKTPGNIWATNDREHPDLDFETAEAMGKATVWICEQPPQEYTGNIVFDAEIVAEHGPLAPRLRSGSMAPHRAYAGTVRFTSAPMAAKYCCWPYQSRSL